MANTTLKERYSFEPDYAVPPGQTLQDTIDHLGMDQRELAIRTGLSAKHVNQIIQGIAPITQDTALILERVTGIPARLWNNLEMKFREQLTRLGEQDHSAQDMDWLKEIPVKELVERGKIEKQSDKGKLMGDVLAFFGVANVDAWKNIWSSPEVAFRKSQAFRSKTEAMATWLRLGELEAQAMQCQPFDKIGFKTVLEQARGLTVEHPNQFVPKIQELCAQVGVAVALVPEIRGALVSGAAQWLTSEKAMIQLSLRYKTNDHFWFSFFHEAGHILNDGKKDKFIDVDHEDGESEERANRFATNMLIPPAYVAEMRQLRVSKHVVAFARKIGIAPGIVVGRLQHDKFVGFHELNDLKIRFQWAPTKKTMRSGS